MPSLGWNTLTDPDAEPSWITSRLSPEPRAINKYDTLCPNNLTIHQLIEKLQSYPADTDVSCYEDGQLEISYSVIETPEQVADRTNRAHIELTRWRLNKQETERAEYERLKAKFEGESTE